MRELKKMQKAYTVGGIKQMRICYMKHLHHLPIQLLCNVDRTIIVVVHQAIYYQLLVVEKCFGC